MSRLSGAVGAVKGFHEGTVHRDDVLATIDDAMLRIQRFKSIELPESRARVDLSQASTALTEARVPGAVATSRSLEVQADTDETLYRLLREKGHPEKEAVGIIQKQNTKIAEDKFKQTEIQSQMDAGVADAESKARAQTAITNAAIGKRQQGILESPGMTAQEQRDLDDTLHRLDVLQSIKTLEGRELDNAMKNLDITYGKTRNEGAVIQLGELKRTLNMYKEGIENLKKLPDGKEKYEKFTMRNIDNALLQLEQNYENLTASQMNNKIQEAVWNEFKDTPEVFAPHYVQQLRNESAEFNSIMQLYNTISRSTGGVGATKTRQGLVQNQWAFEQAMGLGMAWVAQGGDKIALPGFKDPISLDDKKKEDFRKIINFLFDVGTNNSPFGVELTELEPKKGRWYWTDKPATFSLSEKTLTDEQKQELINQGISQEAIDEQLSQMQTLIRKLAEKQIANLTKKRGVKIPSVDTVRNNAVQQGYTPKQSSILQRAE